jgi:hypothetical protein
MVLEDLITCGTVTVHGVARSYQKSPYSEVHINFTIQKSK